MSSSSPQPTSATSCPSNQQAPHWDALSQPTRVRLLHKLRSIHDADHAIQKAYDDAAGESVEQRQRKAITAAPAYLKRRLERGEQRPVVEVVEGRAGREEAEVRAAVLKHVVTEGKLVKEISFFDLMNMYDVAEMG